MLSASDLLAAADQPEPERPSLLTGFRDLDGLTGGIHVGDVWLLTAAPQEGRSTLASQLALQAAVTCGWPTWYICPLADSRLCAYRMLSAQGRVPLSHLVRRRLNDGHQRRLETARRLIRRARIAVMADRSIPDLETLLSAVHQHDRGLVVLDDLSDWADDWQRWVSRLSLAGSAVVATLPHEEVVPRAPDSWKLERNASRAADVIIDVRTREIPAWQIRPGEAELEVLQHRRGGTWTIDVAFQAHYSRFLDLGGPADDYTIALTTPEDT